MGTPPRPAPYASLWILALAFGWIEASVVVYLREAYARELTLGAQVTLVSLPRPTVMVEMAREACTLVVLAAAGWLAGRGTADRVGAFLLSFGIWDLTYYAALRAVVGWPDSLSAWDVLFLIPSPWIAPVWAPIAVAILFVLCGSYLFWTPDRERRYRVADAGVLGASVLLIVTAFLLGTTAAIDHRVPERFPAWLFWSGVVLGLGWFARVERRTTQPSRRAKWLFTTR